jgi:tripartite-type tricarboxylate transporter receptor subunit TctC
MRKSFSVVVSLVSAVIAGAALIDSAPAIAQESVPKLMKIIVPFSAGANNDAIARAIADPLSKRLGNTVIVENKPGAGGAIGATEVSKSAKDGSVLLLTSSTLLTTAATQPKVTYDPIAGFAPVAMVAQGPLLLAVSAATNVKTPAELISAVRAKPNDFSYGSAGVGSVGQMAAELLNSSAQIKMTHVPYKGAANAIIDLAGGQIQVMLSNYSSLSPMLKAGKVRAVAVTSKQPSPAFPELPPLAATVPGYSIEIWTGIFAPPGTPAALLERLNREINAISASPELKALLEPDGATPMAISSSAFGAIVKQDLAQWKQVATENKIVAE